MSMKSKNRIPRAQRFLLAGLGALALGLAGCSGDNGHVDSAPPPVPDPPPGPGTGAPIPITTASTIVASITKVTIPSDGHAVVEIYLHDERNYPLTGLSADNIYFVLSRLEPELNGKSSTWHAITRRQEVCPGTPPPLTPGNYRNCADDTSVNQGYVEPAAPAAWTDNHNGTYRYTFQQSVLGISDIPYNPSLTHRVGFEIRINSSGGASEPYIPANNALYDLVPQYNAPTPITASGRTIVANADCNTCHQGLSVHGGGRHDVNYCAMCHESYSYDAQTGNSLDFRVMIHKIHRGENLPSVAAGGTYGIYGYGNFFANFSDVAYPQDIRNCETCHHENNADAPQGNAWRTAANTNACGSCHDDVNFATGANHGNGVAATDEQCFTCHGPNSGMAGVQTASAHAIPTKIAAGDFKFEIVKIEAIKQDGTPGATPCAPATVGCKVGESEYAKLTIKVTNPRTGTTWALTDAPFTNVVPCAPTPCTPTAARLRARVAYTTRNLTNPGTGNNPSQPIQIDFLSSAAAPSGAPAAAGGAPVHNADGTYTKAGATAIPAGLIGGSGVAYVEGRTIVDTDPSPATTTMQRVGVTASVGVSFPITDATAVPPRQVVDIARCDKCHNRLQLHGDARNDNTGLCSTCHNPGLALGTTAATGEPFDFKLFIHALHANNYNSSNYGGASQDPVTYPGYLNNCEGCHLPGTYYPVDPTVVFASSIDQGADAASPSDDTAITPNTAVCSACHTDDTSKEHMQFNGGSFDATKNADGTSPQAAAETCGNCHGAGEDVDVKEAHHVAEFNH